MSNYKNNFTTMTPEERYAANVKGGTNCHKAHRGLQGRTIVLTDKAIREMDAARGVIAVPHWLIGDRHEA